jgi:hypothetical protein
MGSLQLQVNALADGEFQVTARSGWGDTTVHLVRFPLDAQALKQALQTAEDAIHSCVRTGGRARRDDEWAVRDFGTRLFQFLFQGDVARHLATARKQADDDDTALKICLRILPPDLAALPWELLYDPGRNNFLSLTTSIVRDVAIPDAPTPRALPAPLRVLGMAAQPDGLAPLAVGRERRMLERALSESRVRAQLDWVDGQSWQHLRDKLAHDEWHVLHVIGHGKFDEFTSEGTLALSEDNGREYRLDAASLSLLIHDHRSIRLVVINACESARASTSDLFSSMAAVLERRNVPAVIAMQYGISDRAAVVFAGRLYANIAAGESLDRAVTLARQAISLDGKGTLEWATPVLYLRAGDAGLFGFGKNGWVLDRTVPPGGWGPRTAITGHWSFAGRNGRDSLGKGNDLTPNGGAGFAVGLYSGWAMSGDGSGACASSARPAVDTTHSFTVMAWVRMTDASASHTAVSQDGITVSGFCLQYARADERWALSLTDSDSPESTPVRALSSSAPVLDAWVHLAGTCDVDSGQLALYVNGEREGTARFTATWPADGRLQVGRGLRDGAPGEFFTGVIDDVRTFNQALTPKEIKSSAALPRGLMASYPLDETTGSTAIDEIGGNPLTLSGNYTWIDGPGSGVTFYGRERHKILDCHTRGMMVFPDDSFSVSAWVLLNPEGRGWFSTAVARDGIDESDFYLQYSYRDSNWAFVVPGCGAVARSPLRAGEWVHLVGVYDAAKNELRLYVDGRREDRRSLDLVRHSVGPLTVGCSYYERKRADPFHGSIKQVKIWSRALSDTDVSVLA